MVQLNFFQKLSPSSRRAWIEIRKEDKDYGNLKRSPSSRRAWIEILLRISTSISVAVALLAEGVDRNWSSARFCGASVKSPSSRRAWIEISSIRVAQSLRLVALLAEGVDRNTLWPPLFLAFRVALLAEGVDRNQLGLFQIAVDFRSPSSRRAWIEIKSR